MPSKKRTPEPTINTIVPSLPEGRFDNVYLHIPYGRPSYYGRFAMINGKVYTLHRNNLDLASEGRMGMNDAVRRAYCSLAGIAFKDLMKVVKQKRLAEKNEAESREFRRMTAAASRRGYRLVKVNA